MQARNKAEHMEKALTSRDGKEEVTLLQRVKQHARHIPHRVGLAVLIFAVALCFDLYRLGNPSIWFDEAFSIELARQPLPLLWHIIWGPEPNLAVYAHLFSLLVLFALLCALAVLLLLPNAWRTPLRQQLPALLVSLACTFVLIIPMLVVSLHGAKTGWQPVPHLSDIYHLFVTISGDSKLFFLFNTVCCAGALGLLLLVYVQPKSGLLSLVTRDGEVAADTRGVNGASARPGALTLRLAIPVAFVLLCWLVVPVVVPVVVSFIASHGSARLFSSRYLVVVVPPLCLLVALGIALLGWRVVQAVVIVVLLLVALSVVPHYYASAQVEDWNSTTHWLEQRYQPNDGLVCYDNVQGCQISVEYYLHAYPSAAHFTDDSPGAYSWTTYGPVNPIGGYEAAVSPSALAAYAAKHPRLFFSVGRLSDDKVAARAQAAQGWLDSHYHFVAQIVTRTVTIRLYLIDAPRQSWYGRSIGISQPRGKVETSEGIVPLKEKTGAHHDYSNNNL